MYKKAQEGKDLINKLEELVGPEAFEVLKKDKYDIDWEDGDLTEDDELYIEAIIEFVEAENPEDVKILLELAVQEKEDLIELIDNFDSNPRGFGDPMKAGWWMIYRTDDEAEDAAKESVRQDLDDNPEIFNQDWLLSHIDVGEAEDFFRQVYNEWNYGYAEDIRNESASDPEFENRLEEEMSDAGVDDIDDFVEYMTQRQIDEGEGGYTHYAFNFGEDEAKKLVMEHNLIDKEVAVEEAISTDGWEHFLSTYDGNYSELPSGAVYFREG